MNDKSKEVLSKAQGMLAFLGKTSTVEHLLRLLRDEDKETRGNGAEDLGYLGGRNKIAERKIREALENVEDGIREDAAHALEILEEEKERERLCSEIWET